MKKKLLSLFLAFIVFISAGKVYATWMYSGEHTDSSTSNIRVNVSEWDFLPEQEVDITNALLDVLNDGTECNIKINGVTYTSSYEALIAAFDNSPTSNRITLHNNSYIGTMQQTGDDALALRTLFGDVLTNEEEGNTDYSLMLKREPLDGDENTGQHYFLEGDHGWAEENKFYPGAEMILFSTNWESTSYYGYVTVYATVYTKYPKTDEYGNYIYDLDEDGNIQYFTYVNNYNQTITTNYPVYEYGDWVKTSGASAFIGRAMVVNYSTADTSKSFDTGTWRSTEEYRGLSTGATLAQIIRA